MALGTCVPQPASELGLRVSSLPLPTAHLERGTETTEAALGNVLY